MSKQKKVTTYELFEFMKDFKDFIVENVAMKEDLKGYATKEDLHKSIGDSDGRIIDILDGHTQQLKEIKQEMVFDRKRISRVEFRTVKLLGKKLRKTDIDFEEQYRGEEKFARREV